MVVCKYFQQGFCRFGANCRFEHQYGSKYNYTAANAPAQAAPQQAPGGITDEQLVQTMQTDIKSVLQGGQWILSGYGPIKEKPNYPGIIDLSPEEARLFIYEAKANNTVQQAVAYMNNLTKEARSKYEQLLQPAPNTVKVLRSLYKGEPTSSPFSGQPQNVFGAQTQTDASSLFRSANKTVQSSPFEQTRFVSNTAQSLFAQANNATPSVFAQQPPQFQSSIQPFQSSIQPVQSSPFAQPTAQPGFNTAQSIFGQANKTINAFTEPKLNAFQNDDPSVYSDESVLPAEDLERFKADSFKLGFIPEMPPPRSLCV